MCDWMQLPFAWGREKFAHNVRSSSYQTTSWRRPRKFLRVTIKNMCDLLPSIHSELKPDKCIAAIRDQKQVYSNNLLLFEFKHSTELNQVRLKPRTYVGGWLPWYAYFSFPPATRKYFFREPTINKFELSPEHFLCSSLCQTSRQLRIIRQQCQSRIVVSSRTNSLTAERSGTRVKMWSTANGERHRESPGTDPHPFLKICAIIYSSTHR